MKYAEAMSIIRAHERNIRPPKGSPRTGFMVLFDQLERNGHIIASKHFPDKHAGEKLIPTEEQAWNLARRFACATDETIGNIYVVDAHFYPVGGYSEKELKKLW
jgi:hypothetical protein